MTEPRYLQDLDRFVQAALEHKRKLCQHLESGEDRGCADLVGLEQTILGAVTFYKSYRSVGRVFESIPVLTLFSSGWKVSRWWSWPCWQYPPSIGATASAVVC